MKKTHKLRNFLVILGLIGIIVLGYYVFEYTNVFIVSDISIFGNFRVPDEEIYNQLGVADGIHYFKVNEYNLKIKLLEHPLVKQGEVIKIFPNRLELKVIEREPVVSVKYSGYYLMIDYDLVVVEVSSTPTDFYEIEGYTFENFYVGKIINDDNSHILKRIMDLVFLVEAYPFPKETMIKLMDDEIRLIFNDKFYANFGDGDKIEERFIKVKGVYDNLVEEGTLEGVIKVNHNGVPSFVPFGK